jgi:hypothetical protein
MDSFPPSAKEPTYPHQSMADKIRQMTTTGFQGDKNNHDVNLQQVVDGQRSFGLRTQVR